MEPRDPQKNAGSIHSETARRSHFATVELDRLAEWLNSNRIQTRRPLKWWTRATKKKRLEKRL